LHSRVGSRRNETPRAGPPRKRGAHQHGFTQRLRGPAIDTPSGAAVVKDAGGAGRRREGAQARRLFPSGRRLATGVEKRRERISKLGCCLTVARGFDRPQRAGRSWVLESRRRSSGLAIEARWLGSRRRTRPGRHPDSVSRRERPNPESWMEHALEGKCPGEHRRGDFALARAWGRKRTDSRGEQSFEAGVPAANRRARRAREGSVSRPRESVNREPVSAIAGNRRHGSCVLVRLRAGYRQRAGATGKATVKISNTPRWR